MVVPKTGLMLCLFILSCPSSMAFQTSHHPRGENIVCNENSRNEPLALVTQSKRYKSTPFLSTVHSSTRKAALSSLFLSKDSDTNSKEEKDDLMTEDTSNLPHPPAEDPPKEIVSKYISSTQNNKVVSTVQSAVEEFITEPLTSPSIQRDVPPEVIQNAMLSTVAISLVVGTNLPLAALSALTTGYLAIAPGKTGDAVRKLGDVTYKGSQGIIDALDNPAVSKTARSALNTLLATTGRAVGQKWELGDNTAARTKGLEEDEEWEALLKQVAEAENVAKIAADELANAEKAVAEENAAAEKLAAEARAVEEEILAEEAKRLEEEANIAKEAEEAKIAAEKAEEEARIAKEEEARIAAEEAAEAKAEEEARIAAEKAAAAEAKAEEDARIAAEKVAAAEAKAKAEKETRIAAEEEAAAKAKAKAESENRIAEGKATAKKLAAEAQARAEENARIAAEKDEWEASVRLAQSLEEASRENEVKEIDEKTQWEAAGRLAKELADENEAAEEKMTGSAKKSKSTPVEAAINRALDEEKALQAEQEEMGRAARAAVEMFEAQKQVEKKVNEPVQNDAPAESDNDVTPAEEANSSQDWAKMTVVQLKDVLRSRGLKLSGRKAELVQRLKDS
eukprot:CAMPEP_0195515372 /NCGR_PEP_ID=MMETSP0794_2-20130614/6457_1 /TAXON_ID=515487 /ORGANISM="Stephanopyxis turris, Strain CCMP 815" /LENGTH=622 /DNA_ID=CAMNT_0040643775 /DNA_START=245 /DNA_END=2113 /DNA_ORIENTATION=+